MQKFLCILGLFTKQKSRKEIRNDWEQKKLQEQQQDAEQPSSPKKPTTPSGKEGKSKKDGPTDQKKKEDNKKNDNKKNESNKKKPDAKDAKKDKNGKSTPAKGSAPPAKTAEDVAKENQGAKRLQSIIRGFMGRKKKEKMWETLIEEADAHWVEIHNAIEEEKRRKLLADAARKQVNSLYVI